MKLKCLEYTAWAAVAALLPCVSAASQSTFVSADEGLAFAFSVPEDRKENTYFSLRLNKEYSWGGVGLGSEDMRGALYLIIYSNAKGDGVTFSPRLAYSHMEPEHYVGFKYEVLNDTGVYDDHLYFSARCTERCQSWPSDGKTRSYINVESPDQPAIYALGPRQDFSSDSPTANLKFHREFGTFTMDMERTRGSNEPPTLEHDSVTDGASIHMRKTGQVNWRTTVHAVCMLLSFLGTIPMGIALVKVPAWRKWHYVVETLSLNLVVTGFALGIVTSGLFQKVIGILVVACTLSQWSLGYLHYQKSKKTQSSTTYGLIHIWLGRFIMLLAIINGFLHLSWVLAIVIVMAGLGYAASLYLSQWREKKRARQPVRPLTNLQHRVPSNHQPQPWRDDTRSFLGGHQQMPWSSFPSTTTLNRTITSSYRVPSPRYDAQSNISPIEIGLQPLSPWKQTPKGSHEHAIELDSSQRPAELV